WTGVLTQDQGGYAEEYFFNLQLRKDSDQLVGSARVGVGDIKAEMSLRATQKPDGSWRFEENKILRAQAPEHLEWCLKIYVLKLSYDDKNQLILTGPWWGFSPNNTCVPGKIRLKRPNKRV
ncbi:MAG: hypothetical protein AAFU67_14150, partial [Bacteroidota bacterium]